MGQKWRGGDIARYSGGGHKVNILKENLAKYAGREDIVIAFTDRYKVYYLVKQYQETFHIIYKCILYINGLKINACVIIIDF